MILQADARHIPLADESVQCVVTSPPYWGLRDYGTAEWEGGSLECDHIPHLSGGPKQTPGVGFNGHAAKADRPGESCGRCGARRVDKQLGLERTPEEYVANMVAVFREVKRVLRDDGTCWVNMGDGYAADSRGTGANRIETSPKQRTNSGSYFQDAVRSHHGLKPKDLVGIPWRLAFALQADGWWLRSDIVWAKPNPMPESVTDRPTKSHEYIFLLTKSANYFFDQEAVREPSTERPSGNLERFIATSGERSRLNTHLGSSVPYKPNGNGRHLRSVWTIPTQPYPEAHFATFPEEIPKRCILAGTSARGCCPVCGAPWERVVKKERPFQSGSGRSGNMPIGKNGPSLQGGGATLDIRRGPCVESTTLGFRPHCACQPDTDAFRVDYRLPACLVLDPFAGSGTTVAVAESLGRRGIGLELSWDYLQLAKRRCQVTIGLPL